MLRSCAIRYGYHNKFGIARRRPTILLSSNIGRPKHHLSSSLAPNNITNDGDENVTILYERDASRNTLPKASFLVSSLNSVYWLWYVFDFVPALNASPIEDLHVDPIYGFGGLGLSLLIQSAFTLYPLSLVSKLGYKNHPHSQHEANGTSPQHTNNSKRNQPSSQQSNQRGDILVYKHTLPFLKTSPTPMTIPVGSITMDKASDDTKRILEDLRGDIRKFEGHLGLIRVSEKPSSNAMSLTLHFPLLVDIRSPSEVPNPELMLQALLSGKFKQHRGNHNNNTATNQTKSSHRKQQHRRKHRGAKR